MELKAEHAFDVYAEYTKTGDDEAAQEMDSYKKTLIGRSAKEAK